VARAQPLGVLGKQAGGRARVEEGFVVPGPVRLLRVPAQRAAKGVGVRARQHGERAQTFRVAGGDLPGEAASPVVPDQVEPARAVPHRRGQAERVPDQQFDVVVPRGVGRVGPRPGRIAALVRRDREVASLGQRRQLRVVEVPGDGEAVQREHQRRRGIAGDGHVEDQARPSLDPAEFHHPAFSFQLAPKCVHIRRPAPNPRGPAAPRP
jgi:hypothetical protein